jgi:transposase
MPKKINQQLRVRAVRLVREHRAEYSSTTAVAAAVARQLGVGKESVRRWIVQADIDGGLRPGTSSEESAEIRKLRAENRRLREDVEILRAATTFFVGSSTLAAADHGVHRHDAGAGLRGRVGPQGAHRAGLPDRRADLPGVAGTPGAGGPHHP